MFAVFDRKVKTYGTPFFTTHEASALRSFSRFATDPNTDASVFPNDFELFRIGSYDEDSGHVETCIPASLGTALSFQQIEGTEK